MASNDTHARKDDTMKGCEQEIVRHNQPQMYVVKRGPKVVEWFRYPEDAFAFCRALAEQGGPGPFWVEHEAERKILKYID